jgi:hypothetical protein
MSFAEPPNRMPAALIPIIAASVIACGGYMLFSIRYGKPIRQAEEAIAGVEQLRSDLPGMVENAVEESNRSATAGLEGVLGDRLAETEAARDSFARRIADLEAEIARLRIAAQQGGFASPSVATASRGALAAAESPSTGVPGVRSEASPPSTAGATPTEQPQTLPGPLGVSEKGDLQINLLAAKATNNQVVVEISIVKLTAGDGYFAITNSRFNKHRLVTADGLEIDQMRVGRVGSPGSFSASVDLIPGTPMRFMLYFAGKIPDTPFLARRIEITAYEDRERDFPLQFQFDNILVED